MAIKALELKKEIGEIRCALDGLEKTDFEKRSAEIAKRADEAETEEEKEKVEAEVEALEDEKQDHEDKIQDLLDKLNELEKELKELEEKEPSQDPKEERKIGHMENMEVRESKQYINAFADYLKTGDDRQVRSLLTENASSGTVPVPTYVEGRIRTAWENDGIMSRVRRTYLQGNVKVGFEISATDAVIHTEGAAAPTEEVLTLGIVTMTPQSIKKWITISDEVLDLNGEEFINYIYDELTYKIVAKAASEIVKKISESPAASSATAPGQAQVTAAPALGTVAQAIAALSDQAQNPVVIMNKLTYGEFKKAQYAANYSADPFEGLPVVYKNSLPAYSAAENGAVYMIVGDLSMGAQANFPNGDALTIKYDDLSLAEKDLVKVVGRQFVGLGVVSPQAFVNVKKPVSA